MDGSRRVHRILAAALFLLTMPLAAYFSFRQVQREFAALPNYAGVR
jgi:hypothetical protein